MTHKRYRLSFLLSTLISLIIGIGIFSLLNIEKRLQAPPKEHLVKVALLTLPKPIKKVAQKPIEPKKIMPPTPPVVKEKPKPKHTPKKIVKKHKPKKVVKKHKPKPKKIIKKVIKKHKPKPQKIHKKVIKKHKPKPPQKVDKKIVKKYKPKPKPAYEEVIVPSQPIIRTQPKIVKEITPAPKTYTPTNNDRAKRAFLQKIRNKIIANKKYPKIALRRHIESDVKVRFDITATGQVSNIRFISGKRVFYKSIRTTLANTFPVAIPSNMRGQLPISDVSVVLHFNIR